MVDGECFECGWLADEEEEEEEEDGEDDEIGDSARSDLRSSAESQTYVAGERPYLAVQFALL